MHKAVSIRISSRLRARWLRFLSAFSPSLRTVTSNFLTLFSCKIPCATASSYSRFSARFKASSSPLLTATFSTARKVTASIFSCNSGNGGSNFAAHRTSSLRLSSFLPYILVTLSSGSTRSNSVGVAFCSRPARNHSSTCPRFFHIMFSAAFMTASAFILFAVTSLLTPSPCSILPSGCLILI